MEILMEDNTFEVRCPRCGELFPAKKEELSDLCSDCFFEVLADEDEVEEK